MTLLPVLLVSAFVVILGTVAATGSLLRPWPILLVSAAATAASLWLGRSSGSERVPWRSTFAVTVVTSAVGLITTTYVLWLAWPTLYPITGGPDLVHHLTLIHFLQTRLALPADPAFGAYLGEMTGYPPGAHLIAVVVADVLGLDGLLVVHPVVAVATGVKAGLIVDILARLLPESRWRLPVALAGGLLLLVPHAYLLSPLTHYGFYSQVLAEVFALALWWTFVVWQRDGRRRWLFVAALFGAAVVLTWPVFLPVPVLTGALVIVVRTTRGRRPRVLDLVTAFGPVAVVVVVFGLTRTRSAGILASGGDVLTPSLALFGLPFALLVGAGLVACLRDRERYQAVSWFVLAGIAQVIGLVVLQQWLDATNPYLGFKTVHLLTYGLVVVAALGASEVWQRLVHAAPSTLRAHAAWAAWCGSALLLVALVRSDLPKRPLPSPITADVHRAGTWARAHVPANCVDYLVPHWLTAYWLHLDALGNARASARITDRDPYDVRAAMGRWVGDGSLRYAIVDDWNRVPAEARDHMRALVSFGRAAVVERHDGRGTCWDEVPTIDAVGR